MSRTFIRQDTQIRKSDVYDDTVTPSLANYETNPVNIEEDLNSLRSQVQNIVNRNGASFPTGDWYTDMTAPGTFEGGIKRGVDKLNLELHELERKRVLVTSINLTDVVVTAAQNWEVLLIGELPSNTTAAIGLVTTLGTVAATNGTFGAHSLAEVSGSTAISPRNLCTVVDAATRDPILSSGRTIYALFQTESATDGSTMTGTTPNQAQLSFVRINAAGDDLEACPVGDIAGKTINYSSITRKALEDLTEQDFLRGAEVDTPSSATVTRQVAYDNQGTTPVDLLTNATLDLEGAGLIWTIRDDLEANLFRIIEGSAGGTSQIHFGTDVDLFNNDSAVNDFQFGATIASGAAAPIEVGVTSGLIRTTAGDLRLLGTGEMFLDDGNQAGSTWAQTNGIKLSDTTAEWDAFEVKFGEVSLLNAITQSDERKTKVYANVTVNTSANTDVGGVAGGANLDAQLPDMSLGVFLTDYDVFLNGNLLRPGANAAANHDYYPGTSLVTGQLKFEFNVKASGVPDVICVIPYA
jgi:hypothetical protein